MNIYYIVCELETGKFLSFSDEGSYFEEQYPENAHHFTTYFEAKKYKNSSNRIEKVIFSVEEGTQPLDIEEKFDKLREVYVEQAKEIAKDIYEDQILPYLVDNKLTFNPYSISGLYMNCAGLLIELPKHLQYIVYTKVPLLNVYLGTLMPARYIKDIKRDIGAEETPRENLRNSKKF